MYSSCCRDRLPRRRADRSRRSGCIPGRCRPARQCVIPALCRKARMPPPLPRAAMLAAATRSRCPSCPQCGQVNSIPAGLGTRREHPGRWRTCPARQHLHGDPGGLSLVSQRGNEVPDAPVPGPLAVPPSGIEVQHAARVPGHRHSDPLPDRPGDDFLRSLVLGLPNRRSCRASALRSPRRCCRHRHDPRWPGPGPRLAAVRRRPFWSRRC